MFATSRSASSRAVLRSVVPLSPDGVLRGLVISEETGSVHDERGRAIAKNGRAAEESFAVVHAIELLDHDFLLPNEFIYNQRRFALGQLDEHDLAGCSALRRRQADTLTKPDRRKKIVANSHHQPALRLQSHPLGKTRRT